MEVPHGKARCPRCDGDPDCGFCDGSGLVNNASCWLGCQDPSHVETERKD